jgi:hypothetical protein
MPHPVSIAASPGQPPEQEEGAAKGHLVPTRAVAQGATASGGREVRIPAGGGANY